MKNVKNIILDFGGVLYDIDPPKAIENFAELSNDPAKVRSLTSDDFINISRDYETGRISSGEFIDSIISNYKLEEDSGKIIKAWNSILIGPKKDALKTVSTLAEDHNVVLLSNTNELHFSTFYPQVKELFDKFLNYFLSFKIGYMKPSYEAFEYVLKKTGFKPEETAFVDDSEKNINAAKKLGIKTIHFNNSTLSDLLHTF